MAIVGLGLVGGSLARDLAARGVPVLGYDRDPATLAGACDAGVVHTALDPSLKGVSDARRIVVATPVVAIPDVLVRLRPHVRHAILITDVGSTKRAALLAAERLGLGRVYVGSHPLAGGTASGWASSRAGLFAGARVFLCTAPDSGDEAVHEVELLWRLCGALPERLDAGEHDRRVAWASHLPQLASTALALVLNRVGMPPSELGPGGRDVTRLAASSAELWTGIASENADALAPALAALEASLATLRAALESGDAQTVRRLFEEGAAWTAQGAASGAQADGRPGSR